MAFYISVELIMYILYIGYNSCKTLLNAFFKTKYLQ